ncbi:hypothetical protein CHH28_18330 [Bacterioplanes sanyensis]|uniref:DUF1853 domain-containing protein n=2 Tax=Bacterioplanes sanyensis TaxID=1249553 RepID=A0A222FN97_9GAMM|nr:hypothetical protein CHH28_18330 [Bacterioplanes sanyensis]
MPLPAGYAQLSQAQQQWYWSVCGPSLLDCQWCPARPDWLIIPDSLPEQPPEFSSSRLGFRFEQLWQQYFALMAIDARFNIQVRSTERTLGELDVIMRADEHAMHLELALKFYLGFGDDWIGPNRRDYLADKIQHTQQRQLPLAQHPQTQQSLEPQWRPQQSQALMRGCLFHPADPAYQGQLPSEVNPDHWRGHWCHMHAADRYLPDGDWYILAKPDWISPVTAPISVSRDEVLTYCRRHFQSLDTGLCLIKVPADGTALVEQQRWMLMPDHWPR